MKKTPLYQAHVELGGKIIEFGGWLLPVQYSGVIDEHNSVRTKAGLFDVSHMGEITVKGKEADRFIQRMITNDISGLRDNQIIYSPMCYPDGGVVDDLLVYKFKQENYLLVVNAGNTEKDYRWLQDNLSEDAALENISDRVAQFAVQGPKAEEILQKLTKTALAELTFYTFRDEVYLNNIKCLVSRTGYTGEDGFEIYLAAGDAADLWKTILEAGRSEGLKPAGLGARDTLRFEAALPLYGQEISADISPLSARLGIFVKLEKEDFIGKQALVQEKVQGPARKLVGFEMVERGIPRHGYPVLADNKEIGVVTTGSYSPTLDINIGMALLDSNYAQTGQELGIAVRGKVLQARIVKLPFYQKKYKK